MFRRHSWSRGTIHSRELLALMARRRTIRDFMTEALEAEDLAACLFAGCGITGWTENCTGKLPLSMTPSGGARNPFEVYVVVRNVIGLAPGTYHYDAMAHSLDLVGGPSPQLSELIGGQDWANGAACAIVLVANFDRSMWKYCDANAYRVVLIEAGHIVQNIMLAATDANLTACPSAALAHSAVAEHLGLDPILQAPVYAAIMGRPKLSAGQQMAA